MESTPGEDAVRIDEMTTEGLEYYVNLVDKVEAGFERIDFSFEKSSSLSKNTIKQWVGNPHGEGNGNPLQYSCLETPMDGGAS